MLPIDRQRRYVADFFVAYKSATALKWLISETLRGVRSLTFPILIANIVFDNNLLVLINQIQCVSVGCPTF